MEPDKRLHAWRPDLADRRLEGRVAAACFVDGRLARVAIPIAPLRRRPAGDAPLDTEALAGEDVLVFEEDGEGWSWVQLMADGYVGWMPSEALGKPGPDPTHEVTALRTLVFPGPDIKLPPLDALPMGARVRERGQASDRNADYRLIEPFGAVVVQHLRAIGEASPEVAAVAEHFVGTPYLWGGKSALGLDCSGLVQIASRMAGLDAPRDADMQERWAGEALEPGAAPRRGDLVFWAGHVGIMLDETRLLHANAHHMMTVAEPLAEALSRMEARGVAVSSIRRRR